MSGAGRLVTVAHGTRNAAGNRVAAEITRQAGERLGVETVTAYVELCDPLLTDVLAASSTPSAVLPMLLSTGFHVRQDLPAAVAGAGGPALLGRSLGPHELLARAQDELLVQAGAQPASRWSCWPPGPATRSPPATSSGPPSSSAGTATCRCG